MGEYLLGIDIGTSACKIAVFAKDGTVKATGTGDYQVYYPHPGWAEQNPEEWWEAVCNAIPKVLAKGNISPEEIKGIGIDGQSWSAIAVIKTEMYLRIPQSGWTQEPQISVKNSMKRLGKTRSLSFAATLCSHLIQLQRSSGIREICRKSMQRLIRSFNPTVTLYTN